MNRIAKKIIELEEVMEARKRAGLLTEAQLQDQHSITLITNEDYIFFQNLKSEMQAAGHLTLDESNEIFNALGSSEENFNDKPLAIKVVVIKVMTELMLLRKLLLQKGSSK